MNRRDASPSERTGAGRFPLLPALAPLFDCEADAEALERVLLALAVHPQGAAASRAWWLRWTPAHESLVGARQDAAVPDAEPLAQALGRARRAAPADASGERRLRAWSERPEHLEGALSAAWRGADGALGAGGDQPGAPWCEAPRVAAVRLRVESANVGLLVFEPAEHDTDEAAAAVAAALGSLAESAFAAQRRLAVARTRSRQAALLGEFAAACVASINVAEALHLLARFAAEGVSVRGSAVFLASDAATPKLEVSHGSASSRERQALGWQEAAGEALAGGQRRSGAKPGEARGVPDAVAAEVGAWAVVPISAYARGLGVLAVWDSHEGEGVPNGFSAHDLEFLATLAAQAGLLLAHSAAIAELDRARTTGREQAARLLDQDRLAGVGDLAARVAQEARNPLATIAAFARRAHRGLEGGEPQHEFLEIVVRETERLEAMLAELLRWSEPERPRLRMQALNTVVQEALRQSGEMLVRRRVRLLKKLAPDLPALLLDASRIRRVIGNILAYALECVPAGGRIQVESRRAQGHVLVEVAFDGQRQGGDLLEQLFVPFATGPVAGAAVGLGMAQQIVREHGGEVRVRGESEWNTVFSFTLPVAGNEDRRRRRGRRSLRGDRRRSGDDSGAAGV